MNQPPAPWPSPLSHEPDLDWFSALHAAQVCFEAGDERRVLSHLRMAWSRARSHGRHSWQVAVVLNHLARHWIFRSGSVCRSNALLRRAIAIFRARREYWHLDYAVALETLAWLKYYCGFVLDAANLANCPASPQELVRTALGIRARCVGTRHPIYADGLLALADICKEDSEPLLLQAMAIKARTLGHESLDVIRVREALAGFYESQQRADEELRQWQQIVATRRDQPEWPALDEWTAQLALARSLHAVGRAQEAVTILQAALRWGEDDRAGDERVVAAMELLGSTCADLGDPVTALLAFDRALQRMRERPTAAVKSSWRVYICLGRGDCLSTLGRYAEAALAYQGACEACIALPDAHYEVYRLLDMYEKWARSLLACDHPKSAEMVLRRTVLVVGDIAARPVYGWPVGKVLHSACQSLPKDFEEPGLATAWRLFAQVQDIVRNL